MSKSRVRVIEFKGQHAGKGVKGLTSCTTIVANVAADFLHMPSAEFFRIIRSPYSAVSHLNKLVEEGNELHIKSAKFSHSLFKRISGKDFQSCVEEYKHGLSDEQPQIGDLFINRINECEREKLQEILNEEFKRMESRDYKKDDIVFVSAAAMHAVCLFAKTDEKMQPPKTFYYLFDSAPARALSDLNNKVGTMEEHATLESAVESLKNRWNVWYLDGRKGEIYTVSTMTRTNELIEAFARAPSPKIP